ncbi:MAG: GWxTD domain-containing protein [bacterium]|nr:GWxTD domain-containing protein [bacterium]
MLVPIGLSALVLMVGLCGKGICESSEQSISRLEQVVSEGSASGEDYVALGHAYLAADERGKARRAFQKAISRGATAGGYHGLGWLSLNAKGGGLRAMFNFRRALSENPTFAPAQYHLAVAYLKMRPLEAMGAFEQVVAMDPAHKDAHFQIGMLYEKRGRLDDAIAAYRDQVAVLGDHPLARLKLAKLLLRRGEVAEAMRLFEILITAGGDVALEAYLEMAALGQMAGDFEGAQRLYEAYIARLPEAEQSVFQDISLVASRHELKTYRNMPDDLKAEMIRRFWMRMDPTPLTMVNERRVEHYRRVAHARHRFSKGQFPWDDRGDVYVRLGDPDHVSRSDNIQAEFDPVIRDARKHFANRRRIAQPVAFGLPTFPVGSDERWEYWVYAGLGGGSEVTFVNRFAHGRYSFATGPRQMSMWEAVDLLAIQGEMVVGNMPAVYRFGFAELPIDFHCHAMDFRGANGKTRLEIAYGLPASEAARLGSDAGLVTLDRGVAIYDSLWMEVYRVEDEMVFHTPSEEDVLAGAFIPGKMSVELPPGHYRMNLQVRDRQSGKSRVYRQDLVLEDYHREALQLSDVELAFSIVPGDGPLAKQGMRVVPMASRTFRRGQHAFVYFEAYHLSRDEFGQTRYQVGYTLRSYEERSLPGRFFQGLGRALRLGQKDEAVTVAYDQTGGEADEAGYVALDLSDRAPGTYRVEVRVTDLLGEQVAAKSAVFRVLP